MISTIGNNESSMLHPPVFAGIAGSDFKILVEAIKDYAIFMLSPDGFITSWNRGGTYIYGYAEQEIIGKHFTTIFTEEDLKENRPEQDLIVAAEEGTFKDEGWRIRKDRTRFWAETSLTAIKDELNGLIGYSVITRHISEQKRSEPFAEWTRLATLGTDINKILAKEDNWQVLLQECSKAIVSSLDISLLGIWIYEETSKTLDLEFNASSLPVDNADKHLHSIKPIIASIAETQKPYFTSTLAELSSIDHEWVNQEGLTTFAGYPLMINNRIVGVMALFNKALITSAIYDGLLSLSERIAQRVSRLQAEEELRQREALFRDMFDNAPVAYHELDWEGRFTWVNRTELTMLGYTVEEIINHHISEFVLDENSCETLAAKLSGTMSLTAYEQSFKRKDGSIITMLIEDRLIHDADGMIVGIRSTLQNITKRKQAEDALKESKLTLQELFDEAPVGYHELDTKGRIIRVNRTEQSMLGYMAAEMLGRHIWEFSVGEERARELITTRLAGSAPVKPYELALRRKDGINIPVLIEDRILKDAHGNISGMRSTIQDITERKILEHQLRQAQKLESIGQLAAGIAHEINTPTQYVGDNTRFLKDAFQDLFDLMEKYDELAQAVQADSVNKALLEEIKKAADIADIEYLSKEIPKAIQQSLEGIERITKIVQSMKDFSHPGSTDKKASDLNKAIESTITVAQNEWKYVANMVANLDPQLPLVPCLVGEFNQVILNMIINATHAIADVVGDSGNKGEIRVSTRRNGEFAEIRISDTGTGIPESIRERIFDPFFTTKEVGKGTGQGLAISHAVIVEKHGGTISIESELGKGTTFIISLPLDSRQNS
jgi:two-component system, NtrC family, sensor kinase